MELERKSYQMALQKFREKQSSNENSAVNVSSTGEEATATADVESAVGEEEAATAAEKAFSDHGGYDLPRPMQQQQQQQQHARGGNGMQERETLAASVGAGKLYCCQFRHIPSSYLVLIVKCSCCSS